MRRTRLIENREVFLAYVLANCKFSTIEGLHRRFPLVWKQRDQYKYYKHVCLERPSLKEEYKLKCAYCLFEASKEDSIIFNVLFEELYKQYGALYKQLKKYYGRSKLISDTGLEVLMKDEELINQSDLMDVSIFDFFLEKLEVRYDETTFFNQLKVTYDGIQRKILDFELDIDELNYQYFKYQLTKPNSITFKRVKHFYRNYSDYLGQNVVDVLNDKLERCYQEEKLSSNIQWMRDLGLIDQHTVYRLTTADVYQLMTLLLCTDGDNLIEEEGASIEIGDLVLPISELEAFEQLLNELLPYFVMSQVMKENREFFFRSYTLKDQMISKQLEKEVELLKRDLKSVKETNKLLKLSLSEEKLNQEKMYKLQLKQLRSTLMTTMHEKERLEKELENLKERCAQLESIIKEPSEAEEQVYEMTLEQSVDVSEINKAEIMIVGGATPTIQKLKRILPNCKYFEVDKKYNDQYFQGVKFAILLTNILNHSMTKKLDKHCPKAKKKSVTVTNVDLIIEEIAKFI